MQDQKLYAHKIVVIVMGLLIPVVFVLLVVMIDKKQDPGFVVNESFLLVEDNGDEDGYYKRGTYYIDESGTLKYEEPKLENQYKYAYRPTLYFFNADTQMLENMAYNNPRIEDLVYSKTSKEGYKLVYNLKTEQCYYEFPFFESCDSVNDAVGVGVGDKHVILKYNKNQPMRKSSYSNPMEIIGWAK